jgi:hypothetical protein
MTRPADTPAPKIRAYRASTGLAWVQRGLRLFGRQPLMLVVLVGLGVLVLFTILVLLSVSVRPEAGNLAFMILTPAMSLGALAICRSVDRGQAPGSALYFAALRDPVARLRLLQLGVYSAVYFGLSTLLLSALPGAPSTSGAPAAPAVTLPDAPRAAAAAKAAPSPTDAAAPVIPSGKRSAAVPVSPPQGTAATAAETPMPLSVFLAMVLLLLPYAMTMCFAPVLSGWYGLSAPKALFFSFFACWRNRTALLVYVITLLGISVIAAMILGSLIAILNVKEGFGLFLLVAPLGFATTAITQSANLEMIKDVIDPGTEAGAIAPVGAMAPPA